MKKTIKLGAYGWHYKHWLNSYYPEDMPAGGMTADAEDWRLAYYSNDFNAVLVPWDYWKKDNQSGIVANGEDWLDSVHADFQFFVECHSCMFDEVSLSVLTHHLKKLQPQLSALVFLDGQQHGLFSAEIKQAFLTLIETLQVDVFGASFAADVNCGNIWSQDVHQLSRFACIEHDLGDLRSARRIVEAFMQQADRVEPVASEATLIVKHPQLKASDLSQFRQLIELMGY